MSRIRVLPEAVAARIAAGEVVERPASVVKELVENALDAGARRVEVTLEDGGKRLVRVVDDGCGMDRDDALLAFEQHATSKVGSDGSLAELATFGFRGEALPALASCARVTLVTAERDGEATRIRFDNGRLLDVSSVGAPRGTAVEVAGLFGALPARRKFLRSAASELAHVARFLEQQALALPEVHLQLVQGRPLLDVPPVADAAARVRQLLGREFVENAVRVEASAGGIEVAAWIVKAGVGGGSFGSATILVNGRAVTDRVLSHALREAGRALFGADVTPSGILMVRVPPGDVDVNVHPAKREIRFARPWQVHDAVRDLIRGDVLARGAFAPAVSSSAGSGGGAWSGWVRAGADPGEPFRGSAGQPAIAEVGPAAPSPRPQGWQEPSAPSPLGRGSRILGQHRNTYIVVEDEQGLVLIDQHCAHERILFERVIAALARGAPRQVLLQPAIVELPAHLVPLVAERLDDLRSLGLELEAFGPSTFAVRSLPEAAGAADPADLLRELAEQDEPGSTPLTRVERLAATIACKAAVKAGFPLGQEKMRWIAEELWRSAVPTTCPHGRVAILRLSDRDLDHRFGRI